MVDYEAILRQLKDEREQLEVCIVALEKFQRISLSGQQKPGRPPKWMKHSDRRKKRPASKGA
jgi:hypothetical protein